jgi:hypothetical protein
MNKPKNTICGFVALLVLALGGLAGYSATFLPKLLAGVFGVLFVAFSVFLGMVLASIRHRELTNEKSRNDEEIIAGLHRSAEKLLDQQSRAYGEISKAQSNIVSSRIGIRLVEEMLHGLENDEQRDAAYRQVGQIIEEELAKVNQEVWGDRLCPKDDSVV